MKSFVSILRRLDWFIDQTGKVTSALVVLIMLTMTYEVISRYVFNSPTVWSYDLTYMMGAVFYLYAAPFVLLHHGHVRVDLFYARFSAKVRSILDVTLTPPLFFTALAVLILQSWKFAFRALAQGETSQVGYWEPSTVPLRFALAIGFSLLALEGVVWFLRELIFLATRKQVGSVSHD